MASQQQPILSPEEYLARERMAETKSEYYDGRIYAMGGATPSHVRIAGNCHAALHAQLRGRPCDLFMGDMQVRVPETGLYTYPDVSALCGDARFDDDASDVLLNPSVIVEVLSRSTEAYDRGQKFAHYMRLPSIREYVLIAQARMRVERFTRGDDGHAWVLTIAERADATVELPSIGCTLRVGDLYERVALPPAPPLRAVYEDVPPPFAAASGLALPG
jgi:Uma2 family endonuclease